MASWSYEPQHLPVGPSLNLTGFYWPVAPLFFSLGLGARLLFAGLEVLAGFAGLVAFGLVVRAAFGLADGLADAWLVAGAGDDGLDAVADAWLVVVVDEDSAAVTSAVPIRDAITHPLILVNRRRMVLTSLC